MKGINVKKIAAFAGAFVLGSAAIAAAEVMYGSTQLVDQNGQPTVKIYVGSKAAVSDGVAAANIAAKIANEAYKSSTLTASTKGSATCTVGSGVSGSGTCSIVESSKKVTLQVEIPGTVAGTHTFKTLITDTIDRTLQNRMNTLSEDEYTSVTSATDTSGTITSPLRAAEGNATKARNLYKIGSSQFNGFADYSIVDSQATSMTYTEEQSFWVGSQANKVMYDSASDVRDVVVNKYSAMVYSVKFTGNDYGIPVCTGDLNTTTSDDWNSCGTTSNSMTEKHRVGLKFMGGDWIISQLRDPTLTLNSSVSVTNGGEVKLAKEAKYGIINVGGELDAGNLKVRLSDISVATGSDNKHPAIIDVLDANDAVVGQIQVDPGTTYTFTSGGDTLKIHVYKTAPGFTLNAKWAEMAIYTDEITLKDSSRYNLVSSTDTNKDFRVSLMWKNRDYTGSTGGNDVSADSLREIVVYNIDGLGTKTKSGDVFNFLKSTPSFKVTYQGVDLTDDDYVALTYSATSADTLSRVATSSGDTTCGATAAADMSYANVKLIELKSGSSQLLGGTGDGLSGDYLLEKVYFDPIGVINPANALNVSFSAVNTSTSLTSGYYFSYTSYPQNISSLVTTNETGLTTINATSATTFVVNKTSATSGWVSFPTTLVYQNNGVNGTYNQTTNTSLWVPTVFYRISGRECYNWNTFTYTTTGAETITNSVKFDTAGDNSNAQGSLFFTTDTTLTGANVNIVMKEDAGKNNSTSNTPVYTAVPVIANITTYSTHRFRAQDSTSPQAYYNGTNRVYTNYEPTIVTERGSKVTSVGTSDVAMKIAKRVGLPTFQFAYADTVAATSADEYVLGVGDSKVFGGVTVKVKAIDATSGTCTVAGPGGTLGCSVDQAGVSAVIQPNNAASVEVTEPYKLTSHLVMTDASGASAGVAILVGGPAVNTMTAEALKDSSVDFNVDTVVVKEIGNKIVVAGKTADDTLSAADTFIAGVKRQ
jgi:hypothetical protein